MINVGGRNLFSRQFSSSNSCQSRAGEGRGHLVVNSGRKVSETASPLVPICDMRSS